MERAISNCLHQARSATTLYRRGHDILPHPPTVSYITTSNQPTPVYPAVAMFVFTLSRIIFHSRIPSSILRYSGFRAFITIKTSFPGVIGRSFTFHRPDLQSIPFHSQSTVSSQRDRHRHRRSSHRTIYVAS